MFVASHLTNQPAQVENWNVDALTLAALFYHPALQLARAQSESAAAGKLTAAARPNPTLSMIPGYDFSAVNGAIPWIPATTLDVPIETAGKRRKRILQAQQIAAAARFALTTTAWQVRSNVHGAAIDVWAASARQRLVANAIVHQSTLLRLLQERVTAGAIAANELLPIQVAQVRLQADLAAARTAAVQAKTRLAEAIGIPASNLPAIDLKEDALRIDEMILEHSSELRGQALQRRADILGALARYEAAQAGLQLEIAKQYPDVRVGPGYQWDQGDHKWTVMISLDLPLLNQNQGPIAEAEARRAERAAEVIDTQARAINEIDRAMAMIAAARQEEIRAREALTTLQKQSSAIRERLAVGAADQTEVETAVVEESAAEILALDATVRGLAAEADLEAALQVPSALLESANVSGLASQ